jgi:hypothetical protein
MIEKENKLPERTRKPFMDGPIDIRRWKARKRRKQILDSIRSRLQRNK